jgi:hypothetical protein
VDVTRLNLRRLGRHSIDFSAFRLDADRIRHSLRHGGSEILQKVHAGTRIFDQDRRRAMFRRETDDPAAQVRIGSCIRRRRFSSSRTQPSQITALGLAVALGGLIWQWRQTPPADPQISVLQTRVAQLQRELANTTAAGTSPQPQQPSQAKKITYSERDIRVLLDGLADAHDLIEKHIFPITV